MFWNIYPNELKTFPYNYLYIIFVAALFIIAKTWKQSRCLLASLAAHTVKNPPAMQETQIQSLGLEDSLGEENGNPLQYSRLENSMHRGAWRATVHEVAKNRTRLS